MTKLDTLHLLLICFETDKVKVFFSYLITRCLAISDCAVQHPMDSVHLSRGSRAASALLHCAAYTVLKK